MICNFFCMEKIAIRIFVQKDVNYYFLYKKLTSIFTLFYKKLLIQTIKEWNFLWLMMTENDRLMMMINWSYLWS